MGKSEKGQEQKAMLLKSIKWLLLSLTPKMLTMQYKHFQSHHGLNNQKRKISI